MYTVSFEVSGPTAMFARPDSGSTPISYPLPTWSAAKGMFEAVAMMRDSTGRITAYIHPVAVEICRPIRFERYTTNYGGPLRKDDQLRKNNNYQLIATVLVDVCYKIYGEARQFVYTPDGINWAHALQERFERRIRNGRTKYVPTLGWREFVPDYFGVLRQETKPVAGLNFNVPALLHSIFDEPVDGNYKPVFQPNACVRDGRYCYDVEAGQC